MAKQAKDTIQFEQVVLPATPPPAINIEPTSTGSVLSSGELSSPNFRTGRSGWRVQTDGSAEFRDITASGTFNVGGTTVTINNVDDIQGTLDDVYTAGGGTVYLDNGTYVLTSDINIPSGVTLQGVSRDSVIIDCNTSYGVHLSGTNGYVTGTVTVVDGATAVLGITTVWTSAMIGRYIFLSGNWYLISAVTDNTHLTISTAYFGNDITSGAYAIADVNFASNLAKLSITNASGVGVTSIYSSNPKFNDILVYGCGTGADVDYCYAPYWFSTISENGINLDMNYTSSFKIDFSAFYSSTSGAGMVLTNCFSATIFDSDFSGNTGNGMSFTNCSNIATVSVSIGANGDNGVELISGNSDLQFVSATVDGNTNDGYSLTASNDRITISGTSILNNGGYGINIVDATSRGTEIIAPAFKDNGSGNINDSGNSTVILGITSNTYSATFVAASSQSLSIADASQTGLDITGDITIEAWVKLTSQPGAGAGYFIVNKNNGAGSNLSYAFDYFNNAGTKRLEFFVSTSGAAGETLTKNVTLSNGVWTHVAVAWTASTSTAEFYKDGVSQGTATGANTAIFNGTSPFEISSSAGSCMNGQIDEVRVWNKIRTTNEINMNKNQRITYADNLQGSWHLDNTLIDTSGNANTLTNNNTVTFTTDIPFV